MFLSLLLGLGYLYPMHAVADDTLLQNLYIAPQAQSKPEAIIFYNSANPCENCNKTINLTVKILKINYQKKLHAYLIDLQKHPEFIAAFKLKSPLSLVIIRIDDDAAFGYTKLENLQSRIVTPQDYQTEITEFINNFLGWT